ncbi:MAG: hexokinase [Clostridiales bacterium]|jgi:hexokinase|nr:hexokinase [Clostridiales bacterium]
MENNKKIIENFFAKYEMDYRAADFFQNTQKFVSEMEAGLSAKSSLAMIPTFIPDTTAPIREKSVIALDAGGTNLRVSVVDFDKNGAATIKYFKKTEMPGVKHEVDQSVFFDTLAELVAPVLSLSNSISFCFSYPTEMFPDKDGELIRFTKEVKITGMQGRKICKSLKEAIERKGYTAPANIILLNDAVATLLAGRAVNPGKSYDGNIGFILGTGINAAYSENVANIKKVSGFELNYENMVINLEVGGYDKYLRGVIDKELDSVTADGGKQQFEKMISGAYQGKLVREAIYKAANDGIFTAQIAHGALESLTTKDINQYINNPNEQNILNEIFTDDTDRIRLYYLIEAIIQRAAKLVAITLASIMEKRQIGLNPMKPVCVTMDGTAYSASKAIQDKISFYIKKYINDEMLMYLDIVTADNLTVIGTAVAGAME